MTISLEQKKVFIFDWDGTILDSMNVKLENFSNVLSRMLDRYISKVELHNKIKAMYCELSGRPRKEIFETILKRLGIERHLIDYTEFDNNLTMENKKNLESAQVFPDAEILLKALIENHKAVFISSSMPQAELDFMVSTKLDRLLLDGISGILGTSEEFTKGAGHLNFIAKKMNCKKKHMLVFGDDLTDYHRSADADIDCVLVDRDCRLIDGDVLKVQNIDVLRGLIK